MSKLDNLYELGELENSMQLYVSKSDANSTSLDIQSNWVDYVLNQDWVDNLAYNSNNIGKSGNQGSYDYRITYLSDLMANMMEDHVIDFHSNLEKLNEDYFLDWGSAEYDEIIEALKRQNPNYTEEDRKTKVQQSRYVDAYDKLNSFTHTIDGKTIGLDYEFYEVFKPIGGGRGKYIKVKLHTNGTIDISGVIGLKDCVHVPWEYGSQEYLRSLNTGNQKYEFKLSIPWNDMNSILWWKPDEKEPLEKPNDDDNITSPELSNDNEEQKYRYYKPYETERFLRWIGTNYIPLVEPDTIFRKTICSIPQLSNDVQNDSFYEDSDNLTNMDLTKVNIDTTTQLPLLSLQTKSTIDIETRLNEGQFLVFVVSGNQQTSNISFHITGKMSSSIQGINHYGKTLERLKNAYIALNREILFLETTRLLNPQLDDVWNIVMKGKEYIHHDWMNIRSILESIVWNPNAVDLIRFKQIDTVSLLVEINILLQERKQFILSMSNMKYDEYEEEKSKQFSNDPKAMERFLIAIGASGDVRTQLRAKYGLKFNFFDENLHRYINEYFTSPRTALTSYYNGINLGNDIKKAMTSTLESLKLLNDHENFYGISYETTVDNLRERVRTLNNLIVRLPTKTYVNKIISRNIWLDWKNFVDRSFEYLVQHGQLRMEPHMSDKLPNGMTDWTRLGTDGKFHDYVEYYLTTNGEVFIDYSYCYEKDEDGNPMIGPNGGWIAIHDRFDFWNNEDFN